MFRTRMFWAALSMTVGLLQAWDSGAFGAGALVMALALAGITIPVAAIAGTSAAGVGFAALAAGFVVLTVARIVSPQSLNTLHLALLVPAIYLVIGARWMESRKMDA